MDFLDAIARRLLRGYGDDESPSTQTGSVRRDDAYLDLGKRCEREVPIQDRPRLVQPNALLETPVAVCPCDQVVRPERQSQENEAPGLRSIGDAPVTVSTDQIDTRRPDGW